jgi:hypothetical protein
MRSTFGEFQLGAVRFPYWKRRALKTFWVQWKIRFLRLGKVQSSISRRQAAASIYTKQTKSMKFPMGTHMSTSADFENADVEVKRSDSLTGSANVNVRLLWRFKPWVFRCLKPSLCQTADLAVRVPSENFSLYSASGLKAKF